MPSDGELYIREIRRLKTRQDELEMAIADALSALGIPGRGSLENENIVLLTAEKEAAFISLASTNIKPAGFEQYPEDAQELWNEALEQYRPEQYGKDL